MRRGQLTGQCHCKRLSCVQITMHDADFAGSAAHATHEEQQVLTIGVRRIAADRMHAGADREALAIKFNPPSL